MNVLEWKDDEVVAVGTSAGGGGGVGECGGGSVGAGGIFATSIACASCSSSLLIVSANASSDVLSLGAGNNEIGLDSSNGSKGFLTVAEVFPCPRLLFLLDFALIPSPPCSSAVS